MVLFVQNPGRKQHWMFQDPERNNSRSLLLLLMAGVVRAGTFTWTAEIAPYYSPCWVSQAQSMQNGVRHIPLPLAATTAHTVNVDSKNPTMESTIIHPHEFTQAFLGFCHTEGPMHQP